MQKGKPFGVYSSSEPFWICGGQILGQMCFSKKAICETWTSCSSNSEGLHEEPMKEQESPDVLSTVVFGRRWRSTMSSTGKAIRSSSTVTTFLKPSLDQDQGNKAGQFWGKNIFKGRGTNLILIKLVYPIPRQEWTNEPSRVNTNPKSTDRQSMSA